MIHNIVFDVGRVLLQFDPDAMMLELGYPQTTIDAVNQAMFHHPLWNEFDRGLINDQQLLEKFVSHNPALADSIRKAFQAMPSYMFPFPYTNKWIAKLKKNGFGVYILSNYAQKTFEETKERMTFLSQVDGAVFSYQCGYTKPEPEIYLYLLEKYQLNPRECVFIDDRPENVEAARRLGIKGIIFNSYQQVEEQLATIL